MKIDGRHYRSIWLDADGASIRVIDQTKLPFAFETRRLSSLADAVVAIRDMIVRGAPLIGAAGAYGLALAARADASNGAIARAYDALNRDASDGGQSALGARSRARRSARHARAAPRGIRLRRGGARSPKRTRLAARPSATMAPR